MTSHLYNSLQCGHGKSYTVMGLRLFGKADRRSTPVLSHIIKLTRVNVVDNSVLGKPHRRRPTCIGLYRKKKVATIGDTILLAVQGQKQKALVVGCRQSQKPNIPRFDANNVILIDNAGSPIGTRVKVPVPSFLRGRKDTAKIVAIAKRFV
ncbi:large ribosomal subunit protein uL14m-like isoform X2 [Dysidea avara]|uniref:large ribosomal subunit protein uL14m-like isoform X2 n=1 Tax=Dysidea avara TaxID=196820 RepID=UPI00332B61BB